MRENCNNTYYILTSKETMKARKQWNYISKRLREKNKTKQKICQYRTLHPDKMYTSIFYFSNCKNYTWIKLRESFVPKSVLLISAKISSSVWGTEKKWKIVSKEMGNKGNSRYVDEYKRNIL